MSEKKIGIGSKGWLFEHERRVYQPDDDESPMRAMGGPLVRAKWRPCWVVGETSKSWLVAPRPSAKPDDWDVFKVPKKIQKGHVQTLFFDGAEIEARIWAAEHRYKIESLVGYATPDRLAKIAEILGYETLPGAPKPNGDPWLIEWTKTIGGKTVLVDAEGTPVDVEGRPLQGGET